MQLKDARVLLTGATGGIGLALGKALIQQGAKLIIVGRSTEKLEGVCRTLTSQEGVNTCACVYEQVDFECTDIDTRLEALQQKYSDINLIVHCAGVNKFGAAESLTAPTLDQMLLVNLRSVMLLNSRFIPQLRQQENAAIVHVGSTFGSIGYPGFSAYCATKFGLRGYSEALSRELSDTGIHVVYVAPRATKTAMNAGVIDEMNKELKVAMDEPENVAAQIISAIRKNRLRLFIGWPEKLFIRINGLFAGVVDNALIKQLPVIRRYMAKMSAY